VHQDWPKYQHKVTVIPEVDHYFFVFFETAFLDGLNNPTFFVLQVVSCN